MANRPPAPAPEAVLLTGEDEAARKERLDALLEELLDPATRDFNLDRVSARDADPSALATLLETPPMMAARRVVVLTDAEAAPKALGQVIEGFLEHPCPTTWLLALGSGRLSGDPWSRWRRMAREETFEPPKGLAAVAARVKEEVRRAGKEIADDAAALLAELNPQGTAALPAEVAKLLARSGDRGRVTREDVEAVAVSSAGANRYTFVDLVGMGRTREAVTHLHAFLEEGESPIFMVTWLVQHFLRLGAVRACQARGVRRAEAIARALGVQAWLLTKKNHAIRGSEPLLEQARRYDRRAIDRWLAGLLELDLALKSSRLAPEALMEASLVRLMSAGRADEPSRTARRSERKEDG